MQFCSICECSIDRGVENDLVMPTCDDCAEFEMEDEYDGQPDEMQEWADFDPDCQKKPKQFDLTSHKPRRKSLRGKGLGRGGQPFCS